MHGKILLMNIADSGSDLRAGWFARKPLFITCKKGVCPHGEQTVLARIRHRVILAFN